MNNWRKLTIAEVARVDSSGAWGEEPRGNGADVSVLRTSDIDARGNIRPRELPRRFILRNPERYLLAEGDIDVVKSSGSHTNVVTGKACYIRKENEGIAFTNFLLRLRPNREIIEPEFLYFYLCSPEVLHRVRGMVATTTYPNLRVSEYREFPVPLPPLSEQRRLVDRMKECLRRIEEMQQLRVEALQDVRSVVIAAVRDSLDPLVLTGDTKAFGQLVATKQLGLVRSKTEQGENRTFAYFKMNNIARRGRVDLSLLTRVDATPQEARSNTLIEGDFLFNTRNSFELVGKTAVVPAFPEALLFNNNILRVRFMDGVLSRYVNYAFQHPFVQKELDSRKSKTTNVCAVYYKSLQTLPIPFPKSTRDQKKITGFFNKVEETAGATESQLEEQESDYRALRESILREAFAGNL